jgi:hypothetical protein
MVRDLQTLLVNDDARRLDQSARPFAAELRFGFDDAPVTISLGAGRAVRFRGSVDRVDRTDHGALVVIDYKTGRSDAYRSLGEAEPTVGGTRLQLPVYALAAQAAAGTPDAEASAAYWFVTSTGRFAMRAVPLNDTVLEQVRSDIATVVDGIEAGCFPAHPHRPVWQYGPGCVACDGDGGGTSERWHEWMRKKGAPELAAYVGLAARQGADRG